MTQKRQLAEFQTNKINHKHCSVLMARGLKLLLLLCVAELSEGNQKTLILLLEFLHAAEGDQMLADHL